MDALLWLLIFPIVWPFIAHQIWGGRITPFELGANICIVVCAVSVVFLAGRYLDTRDIEVWNGQVVSKHRDHDTYLESYQCHCHEVCSGSGESRSCHQQCQTCYRRHYTVTWHAKTTVGPVRFKHRDSTSRSVYNEPDPQPYALCAPGEPASTENSYTNYVKGAASSLFHSTELDDRVPQYPRVYDFYRFSRVLIVDSGVETEKLNTLLNEGLRTLGPSRQVNVVVVITSLGQDFATAIENKWLGGKKNDVIVILGLDGTKLMWQDVLTWARSTGNELFAVQLRDAIGTLKEFDPDKLSKIILDKIQDDYVRPEMADFEYLKSEVDPPAWVTILAVILAFIGSVALSVVFYYYDPFDR